VNSELSDLNPQSAADEMTSHAANHFTTLLLGIALVAPWLLLFMSIMSGKFFVADIARSDRYARGSRGHAARVPR
jgi:hypothetical protein